MKVAVKKLDGSLERETRTAPDGLYEIGDLPSGDYEVSARAEGEEKSEPVREKVSVSEDQFTEVNFILPISPPR